MLAFAGFIVGGAALAQDRDTVQGELYRLKLQLDDNTRRLGRLEEVKDMGSRLAVLENDMFEIKWMSRTVMGALVAQLIISGLAVRRKSGNGSAR